MGKKESATSDGIYFYHDHIRPKKASDNLQLAFDFIISFFVPQSTPIYELYFYNFFAYLMKTKKDFFLKGF